MKNFIVCLFMFLCFSGLVNNSCIAQGYFHNTIHPRGLILPTNVEVIKEKIKSEPFNAYYNNMYRNIDVLEARENSIYNLSDLIRAYAGLSVVTDSQKYAALCFACIQKIVDNPVVKTPFSKGLTRANILMSLAMAYDFCFHLWAPGQINFVRMHTHRLMKSVVLNMGPMANYHLESNWMGVRYGAVLFASLVLDEKLDSSEEVIALRPFRWDSKERLRDHFNSAFTKRGWFVETLGYQVYDFRFTLPALIALQNIHGRSESVSIQSFAPNLKNAWHPQITSVVSINNGMTSGVKPDLGDDHTIASVVPFVFGVRLMAQNEKKYQQWMINYLGNSFQLKDNFLLLFLVPEHIKPENPRKGGYLNYIDTTQGILMFRNEFKDENDIIACFNTSSNTVNGHSGPDNLTFRIIGLENIWVVGGGRTSQVKGQTNLFPAEDWESKANSKIEGELTDYGFLKNGGGYGYGRGSCLGVKDHQRQFFVEYGNEDLASAVFVIADSSADGRFWRLNTPEFNEVDIIDNGFIITAQSGATLFGKIFSDDKHEITIERIRYGAETTDHNPGIGFNNDRYEYCKVINVTCERNITVVLTMQPGGRDHPEISPGEFMDKIKKNNRSN